MDAQRKAARKNVKIRTFPPEFSVKLRFSQISSELLNSLPEIRTFLRVHLRTQFHAECKHSGESFRALFTNGEMRTAAVAALKRLGFGKTAAYSTLLPDGRFSAWLHCASGEIITWNN